MNDYSLVGFLHQELAGCQSSLKETSYDDRNKEYLCMDKTLSDVYDFDRYIDKITDRKVKKPASPDAIYIGDKKLYFIEFKNQFRGSINTKKIKEKFNRGTQVLIELLQDFKPRDCKYIFCVVFKAEQSRHQYQKYLSSRVVHFELEQLNEELSGFYDKVITQDVNYYINSFKELAC